MKRRQMLKAAAALPVLSGAEWLRLSDAWAREGASHQTFSRVRPGDAQWASEESWKELNRLVEGRLIKIESPLRVCREAPGSPACAKVFKGLRNPYYIGDHPALTQTSGWIGGWTSQPSVYAVAAVMTESREKTTSSTAICATAQPRPSVAPPAAGPPGPSRDS
jgi:hypothetical protein